MSVAMNSSQQAALMTKTRPMPEATSYKAINYYEMDKINAKTLRASLKACADDLASLESLATPNQVFSNHTVNPGNFIKLVLDTPGVANLLVLLSRLPVFSKDFSNALSHDLDLLAIAKKLKYHLNLTVGENLMLIQRLLSQFEVYLPGFDASFENLVKNADCLQKARLKDFVEGAGLVDGPSSQPMQFAKKYLENAKELEFIDPHAVYPTSIYRHCDGLTLATEDSQTIEAVMSTTLTTTIKIVNKVLDPKCRLMADVYQPHGRCVALVDDKVADLWGSQLEAYFKHFNIELVQLIHGGNEVDKDIQNVEQILIELRNNQVARNEPVLIVGGGVLADLGGFATAIYHRNTPYVMLCTSIVTGIDAGPSPRTCCDGFGFKNLYGAYHPPVLTLTDRTFWRTMRLGWVRHGIAEIIKMACVKDLSLFELLEKAGPRLVATKFGTEGDTDPEFERLCDLIVGKAMEGYVRSEYGNLWETHQCRPHAFGHTWSPGYELPAGMLHGHAVATGMGYGAFLAREEGFINEKQMLRVMQLISDMELSLWHDIMDNTDLIHKATIKVTDKRGGNLCAPVPKGEIGECGYIDSLPRSKLEDTMKRYKALCATYPRGGKGVEVHCREVGLGDPSQRADCCHAHDHIEEGHSNEAHEHSEHAHAHSHDSHAHGECSHSHEDGNESSHDETDNSNPESDSSSTGSVQPTSYNEWIKQCQEGRNAKWKMNVSFDMSKDTDKPPMYTKFSLFHDEVEKYAMEQTSVASTNVQRIAKLTEKYSMFAPCMVGTLESQFLKMQVQVKGAKKCLDVGTFTGMSAMAMAEGMKDDGIVVTLECDEEIAAAAQEAFDKSDVGHKIYLRMGNAASHMKRLKAQGETFDIIFLDADKENYCEYYKLAMDGLLAEDGIILADNSLCALLYDEDDMRSWKLHEFNQMVKNDERVEQVVLTLREGVTLIRRV